MAAHPELRESKDAVVLPGGAAPYHRMAQISFPSRDASQQAAATEEAQALCVTRSAV